MFSLTFINSDNQELRFNDLDVQDQIKTLIERVSDHFGFDSQTFELRLNSSKLDPDDRICETELLNDSTIDVVITRPGFRIFKEIKQKLSSWKDINFTDSDLDHTLIVAIRFADSFGDRPLLENATALLNMINPEKLKNNFFFMFPMMQIPEFIFLKYFDINLTIPNGETMLFVALQEQKLCQFKRLIKLGIDINVKNNKHVNVITQAVHKGLLDYVKILIEAGASTQTDRGYLHILILAAREGHLLIVKYLHESGIDLNIGLIEDNVKHDALFYAINREHFDIARYLVGNGAEIYHKHLGNFVVLGKINCVECLLDIGADPNVEVDVTPLSKAAKAGNIEIVKLLLARGASANLAGTNQKLFPLFLAADNNHFEIVKLLVENGADVNQVLEEGNESAIFRAVRVKNDEMVDYLLDKRACVKIKNKIGVTLIASAALAGSSTLTKKFVDMGLEIDSLATNQRTPLFFAVISGCADTVRVLLKAGADPNAEVCDGKKLIQYAKEYSILHELISHGGEFDGRFKTGKTLLQKVIENDDVFAVKKILAKTSRVSERTKMIAIVVQKGNLAILRHLLKSE